MKQTYDVIAVDTNTKLERPVFVKLEKNLAEYLVTDGTLRRQGAPVMYKAIPHVMRSRDDK